MRKYIFDTKIVEANVAPKNIKHLWFDTSEMETEATGAPRLKAFTNGGWNPIVIPTPEATSTPTPVPTSTPEPGN